MQPPPRPPETNQALPEPIYQEQDWEQLPAEEDIPPSFKSPARRIFRLAVILVSFLVLLFVLRYHVFTISRVQVVGNHAITWQEVARSAGLERKLLYFTVNEDEIADGVNANRYLAYMGMEKVFPNMLILYIRERIPSAFFTHLGVGFVMADDGMILEKSRDLLLRMGFETDENLAITSVPPEHPTDEGSIMDSVREILSVQGEEPLETPYGERLAALLSRRMAAAEQNNHDPANHFLAERLFACREPHSTPDGRACTTLITFEQIDKIFI